VFLLVLITFWPILVGFEGFGGKKIQDGGFKIAAVWCYLKDIVATDTLDSLYFSHRVVKFPFNANYL